MAFGPAPLPKSLLGIHRILSPKAGVRVSPLCLGAMNFGEAWSSLLGECSKETAFSMMDYFYENGGNFIDTANVYQGEESEIWIGEWMAAHKNRDEIVLATKYTSAYPASNPHLKSNYQGNHSKSLKLSVEASLKKLQTDYIDLLYLHWWDFSTDVAELMQSLGNLVTAGKVLYLGVSDTPAWIVSRANEYARSHGLPQFVVYQGEWSASKRDFERDILPMCESEGMALAPWGALGRGLFKTEAQMKEKGSSGRQMGGQTEQIKAISAKLDQIAQRKSTLITSVALAYVMHKAPYVYPIVGGRTVEHIKGNIEALKLELSDEDIAEIEDAAPFDIGFPLSFLFERQGVKYNNRMSTKDVGLVRMATHLDTVEKPRAIKPREL